MNFLARDLKYDPDTEPLDIDHEEAGLKESKLVLSRPNVYALTINPSDDFQHFTSANQTHEANNRLESFKTDFRKLLDRVFEYHSVVMVVEISEPITGRQKPKQARPRLHAHGLIQFDDNEDIRDFLLNVAPELAAVCSYSVKPIGDLGKWDTYCHKQQFLGWPVMCPSRMAHLEGKTRREKWDSLATAFTPDVLCTTEGMENPQAFRPGIPIPDKTTQCEAVPIVTRKKRRRKIP